MGPRFVEGLEERALFLTRDVEKNSRLEYRRRVMDTLLVERGLGHNKNL